MTPGMRYTLAEAVPVAAWMMEALVRAGMDETAAHEWTERASNKLRKMLTEEKPE